MPGRRRRRRVRATPRAWWQLLDDMRSNAKDAETFLSQYRYAENSDSRQAALWAIWSKMMIVGEAAAQVVRLMDKGLIPERVCKNLATVALWDLIDERDSLIHDYWDVNEKTIVGGVGRCRAEIGKIDRSLYQEYLQLTDAPRSGDE